MGKAFLIIFGVVALLFLCWVGLSIWHSSCGGPSDNPHNTPKTEEATHSFRIENTGGLIFASDFEQHGVVVGSRIFIIKDEYWELRGQTFKLIEHGIVLDEKVFGKITVKRR